MWRVEYVGENERLFGRTGWAEPSSRKNKINVKLDQSSGWEEFDREDFEETDEER